MILALKIIEGIIVLLLIALCLWFLRLVVINAVFGTEQCKDCPMKNECFSAIANGESTLCNNKHRHTLQS